jgi:predicted unusual protein kinase regulating ubiquinone biosynthesis (AarF/ABC1/UbiB family)
MGVILMHSHQPTSIPPKDRKIKSLRRRYHRITFFFIRVLVILTFWELILPHLGLRKLVQRTRANRLIKIAKRFRQLAIDMGGVMIKVGQFLSSRLDLLPQEIINELSGLQDEVPEEDFDDIKRVVEEEFGVPIAEKFLEFQERAEAAASLGQVHQAKVYLYRDNLNGDNSASSEDESLNVVVKVQRPNIEKILEVDLTALYTVGNWLQRYRPIRERADIPALLAEFSRILYAEIDYIAEGKNAETFAQNFQDKPDIRIPSVIWTHTTKRILTLEDVRAIKITDYEAITAAGINRAEVANRLLDVYLKQIFEDGFFHADPHPGNLFVSPMPLTDKETESEQPWRGSQSAEPRWQLTFVDFGMVGRVSPRMLEGMSEMLIAIGTRDGRRLSQAFQTMGVLLPNADISKIEAAVAKAFERFWGKSMKELRSMSIHEVHQFAREFRELIYAMPFQIPQDMLLLGRTVGILAGMCSGLNPEFNVWERLVPYAQGLIAKESALRYRKWVEELTKIIQELLSYPARVNSLMHQLERGELEMRTPQLEKRIDALEVSVNRLAGGAIFAAFLISGIQLLSSGQNAYAFPLLVAAGITLLWLLLSGKRQ